MHMLEAPPRQPAFGKTSNLNLNLGDRSSGEVTCRRLFTVGIGLHVSTTLPKKSGEMPLEMSTSPLLVLAGSHGVLYLKHRILALHMFARILSSELVTSRPSSALVHWMVFEALCVPGIFCLDTCTTPADASVIGRSLSLC